MPIPKHILENLTQTRICAHLETGSIQVGEGRSRALPHALAPLAWGIAPGLLGLHGGEAPASLVDLDHRLHQAGIQALNADFDAGSGTVEGRLLLGIGRARAVSLAYKLREWAVFGLHAEGMDVVYSGHNSRSR
jgi:hypothetical protein